MHFVFLYCTPMCFMFLKIDITQLYYDVFITITALNQCYVALLQNGHHGDMLAHNGQFHK